MIKPDRDIKAQLNQKPGNIEPQVGDWKPKQRGPIIGCLIPVLLVDIILSLLWVL